jgi:hypothetical protein
MSAECPFAKRCLKICDPNRKEAVAIGKAEERGTTGFDISTRWGRLARHMKDLKCPPVARTAATQLAQR